MPTEIPGSEEPSSAVGSSYGQILKSSSILGGAQGLSYLIAMARTKAVAILLGPAGVGVVSLYQSMTALLGTIAGLGIPSSGVREVAEAYGGNDLERTSIARLNLRRISWVTGIVGWILTAALSYPLSQWTFGSHDHALAVAILGASVLISTVTGVRMAVIQGMRRIGDIAKIQILSMTIETLIAIGLYGWLKEKAIIPVLIGSAAISYCVSWYFASKIPWIQPTVSWKQTWHGSRHLIGLGVAFVWTAILAAGIALAIRTIIVRDLGIEANGIFQSAWGISGMFAGFILAAMGTDFYPRLTAVSKDHPKMNQMVNEQTEIAILLAFPGLIGTLVFAPWLMKIFYTAKFIDGAILLPWFVLGVFLKVVSWPMGFILLAKGEIRWFIAAESLFNVIQLGLTIYLMKTQGIVGTAHAFAILYGIHIFAMLALSRNRSGFTWSPKAFKLLAITASLVTVTFLLQKFANDFSKLGFGTLLCLVSALISMRGIVSRLGNDNRMSSMIAKLPCAGLLFGTAR